jgi:hypothetical protein
MGRLNGLIATRHRSWRRRWEQVGSQRSLNGFTGRDGELRILQDALASAEPPTERVVTSQALWRAVEEALGQLARQDQRLLRSVAGGESLRSAARRRRVSRQQLELKLRAARERLHAKLSPDVASEVDQLLAPMRD